MLNEVKHLAVRCWRSVRCVLPPLPAPVFGVLSRRAVMLSDVKHVAVRCLLPGGWHGQPEG